MSTSTTWGRVSAAPHEHLILLRDGKLIRAQQGGSCWRWPGDTVALVDTSVKRLQFTADQITLEKVGVAVTGLAVWRIVQPALAWRMLNLQEPDALSGILQEMLIGATRRLVANLSLDECLTRRKHAIAEELMAEIAPVVSGSGRAEDGSDRGWGVALDTIEIQDVRVLSAEVFERLQARYRETLALEALAAHAEVERAESALQAEKIRYEEDRRRALLTQQEARLQAERARAQQDAAHRAELARIVAEEEMLRAEHQAESEVRVAAQKALAERALGEARAELTRIQRAAEAEGAANHLRLILATETLPRMAEAMAGSVERSVVVSGGEHDPVTSAVARVLGLLKGFGVELGGVV